MTSEATSEAASEAIDEALAHERAAVAQLVSLCEDRRPQAAPERDRMMAALRSHPARRRAVTVGVTGAPGSGKSTLLGRVALALVRDQPTASVAVLAVDPSSRASGGALLGDRTRVHFPPSDRRLFFRSQAAEEELGGLGPSTFAVSRLLASLYDYLFVETVGVGQSEGDVRALADRLLLVMPPLAGDEVQLLKAGIMELPDAFVVNKSDEESAMRGYHQLRSSLWLARPLDGDGDISIFRTSARTGQGIDELTSAVAAFVGAAGDYADKEPHFFARWVRTEFGRHGRAFLDEKLGGDAFVRGRGYDQAQRDFAERYGSGP